MSEEIPLAPVSGWEVAPISAYGAVTLRLSYLTHQTQKTSEAHQSPTYVLLAPQCRELMAALQRQLDYLAKAPPEGDGLQKH
jgi:hypothetical protein